MTQTATEGVKDLRTGMTGSVFVPADAGYDDARKVWNADIDRHPAVIARCRSTQDVVAAIALAREQGWEISIRGGAHNTAGTAICDNGLMIDLSELREVTVDPEARRVRVGGGALLSDMDAVTQAHGLAVPAGLVGHTGVGGLTLGGGMGWLTRRFGLSIDSLVSAEVVVADGRVLRAAEDEHSDLFWALRGGGGNFGVVTSFEFRLHEVDPMVLFGLFFWPLDRGVEAMRLAREIIADMPLSINAIAGALNAPPAPFVPEQHHFRPGYVLLLVGFGADDEHGQLVQRIRETLPPLFDMVAPMPYVELQKILDESNAWGLYCYEKGTYIENLSDGVIEVVTEHMPLKKSPMSLVLFYRLDGAYSQVGDDDTALAGGRSPRFGAFIIDLAPDTDLLAADRGWVRAFWEALLPHAVGSGEGYINTMVEFGEDRVRSAYGAVKYDRLARIKGEYDPENIFHLNANIKPVLQGTNPDGERHD
ncbi:MAG: FAD-binding oxidoreductase [Actinobacteria bacterium]|nr:FAD-binding oxidoreductase [Actinomycetota bacterium]